MRLRPLLLSIASLALLGATGCRAITGGTCHKPQAYESAGNLAPLRMPTGLESPDTSGALAIPEVNQPELPVDPEGPCLEAPPALVEPPPPPSEVAAPERDAQGDRTDGSDAAQAEQEPERRRRRTPRRPR